MVKQPPGDDNDLVKVSLNLPRSVMKKVEALGGHLAACVLGASRVRLG